MQMPRNPLLVLLFIAMLILPWVIFFFLPAKAIFGHLLFWLAIFLCLLLIWLVSRSQRRMAARSSDFGPRMLSEIEQPEAVRQVMDVRIAIIEDGLQLFRGPLRDSASVAFEKL